jgi:hypothetical protein
MVLVEASLSLLLFSAVWLQPAAGGAETPSSMKRCKKGRRATTECFFAAGTSETLTEYVDVFVDEGFETCVSCSRT